jgi:hypothetical protein
MKKLVIFLFLLVFLATPVISAEYGCTNESIYSSKTREIDVGENSLVNGIGISLTYSDEASIVERMVADILVDSEKLILSNDTNMSIDQELLSGSYDITLKSGTENSAKIEVGGSSEELETDDIKKIGGLYVFLYSIAISGKKPTAEILVGTEKLSLSKTDNPEELVTLLNKKYLISLSTASDNSASILVGQCNTGDVIILSENPAVSEEIEENLTGINETEINSNDTLTSSNGSYSNESEVQTEEPPLNETSKLKALDIVCEEDSDCPSGNCSSNICQRKGIFSRFIAWLKNLF